MKLPLPRIAEFISAIGEYDNHGIAQGYSIDSRTIQPGELFFAVQGERLDGHDFVEQALRAGAVAAVVRKDAIARYAVTTNLLALGNCGAASLGEDSDRHHWIDGQDDDQGCDGTPALFSFLGAQVGRQFQ